METYFTALQEAYPLHTVSLTSERMRSRPKGCQWRYTAAIWGKDGARPVKTKTCSSPSEALLSLIEKASRNQNLKEFYAHPNIGHHVTIVIVNT